MITVTSNSEHRANKLPYSLNDNLDMYIAKEEQLELDKNESRKNNGQGYQWWTERKVHRYQFWARRPELYKGEPLGMPYVFLDHGFFDLVPISMLIAQVLFHIFYAYAIYQLIDQGLWHMLPLCE